MSGQAGIPSSMRSRLPTTAFQTYMICSFLALEAPTICSSSLLKATPLHCHLSTSFRNSLSSFRLASSCSNTDPCFGTCDAKTHSFRYTGCVPQLGAACCRLLAAAKEVLCLRLSCAIDASVAYGCTPSYVVDTIEPPPPPYHTPRAQNMGAVHAEENMQDKPNAHIDAWCCTA